MTALIREAVAYAGAKGAHTVEAAPTSVMIARADRFMGVDEAFLACGFAMVEQRSEHRTLMRIRVREPHGPMQR